MFLRQNFIFCRLCLRGSGGSGVLSGVATDLLTVCEFSSGWDGYILRSGVFQRKSKDLKKCDIIQFLHIFIWEVMGWFREIFGGYEPTRGRKGLYITLISVDCPIWVSFGELLAVFSACFPSSAAVLRLLVGADSVRFRQAVRRSVIYVCIIGIWG